MKIETPETNQAGLKWQWSGIHVLFGIYCFAIFVFWTGNNELFLKLTRFTAIAMVPVALIPILAYRSACSGECKQSPSVAPMFFTIFLCMVTIGVAVLMNPLNVHRSDLSNSAAENPLCVAPSPHANTDRIRSD